MKSLLVGIRKLLRPQYTVGRGRLGSKNFIFFHYAYFVGVILMSAIVIWASSTPSKSVTFTDALFLAASAMTEAGLNTINLSTLNTFQQFMLFLLIIVGSAILVSAVIVHVRLKAFENEFRAHAHLGAKNLREHELIVSRETSNHDTELQFGLSHHMPSVMDEEFSSRMGQRVTHPSGMNVLCGTRSPSGSARATALFSKGLSSFEMSSIPKVSNRRRRHSSNEFGHSQPRVSPLTDPSTINGSIIAVKEPTPDEVNQQSMMLASKTFRNSQFHGLTPAERRGLGGSEYKAVLFLSYLVPLYFIMWQFLGAISMGAWISQYRASTTQQNGLNPWWVGAFNAVSAFNNSGMSLLDANMTAFQADKFLLLSMGLFILAGNTAYPIFLRSTVWILWKSLPHNVKWEDARSTLRFLLDHPRRCYTNMFPARHTWWLALALITLNGVDWAAFEILNIGNNNVSFSSSGDKVVDGLFQAFAVRSGGFYVVNISQIRISLQMLYVIMMYISVYPVVITMRNSNVYEERSLGIFADNNDGTGGTNPSSKSLGGMLRHIVGLVSPQQQQDRAFFVQQQLRAQLAHDAWWIALAIFVITIIEGSQIEADPAAFSVFNIIFEVVSGYGTVGISVGVPSAAYSFCGSWHTLSKLVLVAVMIRGRHRGLPVAIDHAVQLPGAGLDGAEEDDGRARREMVDRRDWAAVAA